MSIDQKFVELTADVLDIYFFNMLALARERPKAPT